MTLDEAKHAIKNRLIVQRKDDNKRWGIITCLSDDESICYFQPNGCGFTRFPYSYGDLELDNHANKIQN